MSALPVLVSWSSGKDSAWALHTLRSEPEKYDVRGIFTTVTTGVRPRLDPSYAPPQYCIAKQHVMGFAAI